MMIKLRLKGQVTGCTKTKVTQLRVTIRKQPGSSDTNLIPCTNYHYNAYFASLIFGILGN